MSDPPLFWLFLLLFATATFATSNKAGRSRHILAGGHLRILNEDPNDTELLTANASGSGKVKKPKQDDDERKTLSQQVADGKYALIQKELFSTPIKRPGVVSYESNSEVPKDNINNLGGLSKNDIWLAENHLLVVKGGIYPHHEEKQDNSAPLWPPIDDFKAPDRPVKLPAHPKVPPPFPVQLTDDGPLQILGTNSSRTLNGSLDEDTYPVPPPEGYIPGTGPFFPPVYPYPPDASSGKAPYPNAPYPQPPGDFKPGAPFPPLTLLNGTLPPYFASLPPGAVILPPPNNITEVYDEDDPSIYYPPPYSFYYPNDTGSNIKAGPLVPGIILPPPPNFFAPLEESTIKTILKPSRRPTQKTRGKTTTKPIKQIRPTTTPVPITSVIENRATKKPVKILPNHTPTEINNELNAIVTTTLKPVQRVVTVLPVHQTPVVRPQPKYINRQRKPQSDITILKPIITKTTQKPVSIKLTSRPVSIEATSQPDIYIFNNEVSGKPFAIYGPPKATTSTTQLPLKLYYTTSNDIESNSVTDLPTDFQTGLGNAKQTNKRPPQANYYYYDDKHNGNRVTTPQAIQELQDTLYYFAGRQGVPTRQQQKQFYYVTPRPYGNQKTRYQVAAQTSRPDPFKIHVGRLQKQIQQYYTTSRPYRPAYSPKPVYQYSFQAANYQPNHNQSPIQNYQQIPQQNYQQLPQQNYQQHPNQEYQGQLQNYEKLPQPNYQQVQQNFKQLPQQNFQQLQHNYQPQQQFKNQHRDFRAPKPIQEDAQDKFRPIPHYSVQIQAAVDLTPTEQPIYQNPRQSQYQHGQQAFYQASTERPTPNRYYRPPKPDYDYEVNAQRQQQYQQPTATPKPVSQFSFGMSSPNSNAASNIGVTPNPIYQGYYTKPDEGYFDDITKKYFTIFGKKIPNATTPITQIETSTRPSQPVYIQAQRQTNTQVGPQQPISLAGDILVNYLQPRPSVNPDAEFVDVNVNKERPSYPRVAKYSPKPAQHVQNQQNDNRQKQLGNNPEIIRAIPIRVPDNDSRGSFISYELPGDDGAHFYFLTPQLARRRDQGAGFYYSQPSAGRKRRDESEIHDTTHQQNSETIER